ncbi:MAG: hypothetical protein ABEH81_02665 [Halopenitus sp.]
MDEPEADDADADRTVAAEQDGDGPAADEPELDLDEAGGPLAIGVVAVLAGIFVAILGVPLLGIGWTQALVVGGFAGVVAAVAAVLGSRHATPE